MSLDIVVKGIALQPGLAVSDDELNRAGLSQVPGWRCFLRRLPGGFQYWEASDPRIECFTGKLDIFACRDSYLDQDRKWGTAILLQVRDGQIHGLTIQIIDGVYAAGNYYNGFNELICERFGEPGCNGQRQAAWDLDRLRVESSLSTDATDAVIRLTWMPESSGVDIRQQSETNAPDEKPASEMSIRSR